MGDLMGEVLFPHKIAVIPIDLSEWGMGERYLY
jgi:hypothetical protein